MLDYILLNKKKVWGLITFFLIIFVILSIANRNPFDFTLQKAWMNIVMAAALSIFGYFVFLLSAFIDNQRANTLFASSPFKILLDKGFTTEFTAVNSRFLFAGKRIEGTIDGFPVKIGGSGKRFSVFIGIDARIAERLSKKQLVALLKPKGLTFEDIFVETKVQLDNGRVDDRYVYNLLVDRIDFLKANGFEPRA
ncbi:hypothetical protein D3H65_10980 [Paraflavitalea soli]|uniref:Uncharacterized protein n=1 Tax=Paraflavitalea soli TaxID=2315862 RepID=A0A3B7MMB6_9BACT|nr:hypothetical protein [Paraflavitalea soli]AXY74469.1 hypothetical protein D3H65_10980 [Paraflavitalea soli]